MTATGSRLPNRRLFARPRSLFACKLPKLSDLGNAPEVLRHASDANGPEIFAADVAGESGSAGRLRQTLRHRIWRRNN